MHAKAAFTIGIASLVLTACSAPTGQAPSPATSSNLSATVARATDAISSKSFAGEFNGVIPCEDCAGIKTHLTLDANGSYQLNEFFSGRTTDNVLTSHGKWDIEDTRHFVLIPSEQGWEQRPFVVLSHNEVSQLGKDYKPYPNDAAYHLKRVIPTTAN